VEGWRLGKGQVCWEVGDENNKEGFQETQEFKLREKKEEGGDTRLRSNSRI